MSQWQPAGRRTELHVPRRTDIRSILLIGSGPIVIGQACEFDYSGTQACKALREEGYRVILVNSNPATIMTDPEFADRTYIEPMTVEVLERIIAKVDAIRRAEDRALFKATMASIGLDLPRSGYARSPEEAEAIRRDLGLPLIIRPSRTLGGTGGSFATTDDEFRANVAWGLDASPVHEVLVEESIAGWKEFELEVMRDGKDNVVIVCSIENFDPMGVHTGDSITVAPAQTLTDKEYQVMRDAAVACIRAIGVDTGGSNIQFAVEPTTGRLVVIEMNPRVSRSSALASKATGFPIAKIAAKLAVGYTLDEIPNDITRETPACFEPTIDYVVTKIPRFTFEKFPQATDVLGPQMKSVGEAMAIGRTFKESLQKAMRSLEIGSHGFEPREGDVRERLCVPNADRLWYLGEAFRRGMTVDEVAALTAIDPWFLRHVEEIIAEERTLAATRALAPERLRALKQQGFADVRLAALVGTTEDAVRAQREGAGIEPVYKTVDTCGAEFEAHTPYLYSTYEEGDDEAKAEHRKKKIVILGGGPNRIGQGIEFDYCCVHAALALREDGFETIMVNCNPETVSTDYDTSDKLYFEPLTLEDTLALIRREEPDGVVVQFGGQTPLRLAVPLERAGVPIIGTAPDSIDRAEDRERFEEVLAKLDLRRPPYSLDAEVQAEIRRQTVALARELGVVGLMNVQFAVKARVVYVLEVNPRASRTVPFVSKAIGVPLAKVAARCMVGRSLAAQGCTREIVPAHVNVKEAVFPFIKFPGVDTVLGPEMKSTGEVMGIDGSFGAAFAKAQIAASTALPTGGQGFIFVALADYQGVVPVARRLSRAGFSLLATRGTGAHLRAAGLVVEVVNKVSEGGPHIVDALRRGEVALVVNTPAGADSQRDAFHIRRTALECRGPSFTTLPSAPSAAA